MTPRQKRIIIALIIANVAVILALATLMRLMAHSATPTVSPPDLSRWQADCEWQAAQHLAQAGMGGTVTLAPSGALHVALVHPVPPDHLAPAQATDLDEAAQSVWTAFDVALALQKRPECAGFTQVQVVIRAHSPLTDTRISATVSSSDLSAYGSGTLSETAFIERVNYQVTTLH